MGFTKREIDAAMQYADRTDAIHQVGNIGHVLFAAGVIFLCATPVLWLPGPEYEPWLNPIALLLCSLASLVVGGVCLWAETTLLRQHFHN